MSLSPSQNTVTKGRFVFSDKRKKNGFLFGPFVGSLEWELYRFAPYAIYLKKRTPSIKLVVFTRSNRFDLYGQYADVLVPLDIVGDDESKQDCFKSESFSLSKYKEAVRKFQKGYRKKYIIKKHFYPSIEGFRYKLKWQFPRYQMSYDFQPRQSNTNLVNQMFPEPTIFVDLSWLESSKKKEVFKDLSGYDFINYGDFKEKVTPQLSDKTSVLGCVIRLLKRSKLTIGNLNSPISHLSILLGTPLVSLSDYLSEDAIGLLNPLKTKVVQCDDVLEGLKECESILT